MIDMLLRGQFWVKNELIQGSWQSQRRGCCAKSNQISQGGKRWKVSRKTTKREREEFLFCRRSVWADFRSSMIIMSSRCMHWVLHWEERISGAVCHLVYRAASYDIGERCSVQDEENGPQYSLNPEAHRSWAVMVTKMKFWLKWTDIWEVWLKPLECSRLNAKKRVNDIRLSLSVWLVCVCVCRLVCVTTLCVGGGGGSLVCVARAHVQSAVAASLVRTCDGGGGGGGLLYCFDCCIFLFFFIFWQSVLHVWRKDWRTITSLASLVR